MNPLIRVRDLNVHFPVSRGVLFKRTTSVVRAVDRLSFEIMRGETLSLVGESGCGKSTLARAILQLERPTSGRVYFGNTELTGLAPAALRRARRRMQMIFQDPYSSLNPRMTVAQIVAEPLLVHGVATGRQSRKRVAGLLQTVGLSPGMMHRYPHEFSGGQRQRIGIARALAVNPDFIVCDEAIAALDVSIQAQIINLLKDLQRQFDLTYLFIAHDLAVVKHLSRRVAAMYAGRIVELADRDRLYDDPRHPYTRLLLSAVPVPDPGARADRHAESPAADPASVDPASVDPALVDPALSTGPATGCSFSHRCPLATGRCRRAEPELRPVAEGHEVACFHA